MTAEQPEPASVVKNDAEGRFELAVGDHLALLQYREARGLFYLIHTEVPAEIESQGIGRSLAVFALDYARARGLEVIPFCPFVAAYIKRHPEYFELVSDRYKRKEELRR